MIELLCAVVIMAALAILLFPAGSSILKKSKQAATAVVLKNLGASIMFFSQDNNGALPGPNAVAVWAWAMNPLTDADNAHLGNWLGPYYQVPQDRAVHLISGMRSPMISSSAQSDRWTAQFITPRTTKTQPIMGNIGSLATVGSANAASASGNGPKKLFTLSSEDKNVGIVTTADKQNWNSAQNTLLPNTTANERGERLYLFLDGTVELCTGLRNQ